MKKTILLFAFLTLLVKGYAYDFSAVCETGQTLYYEINSGGNNEVTLVAPGYPSWTDFVRPTGNVVVPEQVQHQGIAYTVVKVNGDVFRECPELTSVVIPNTVTYIGSLAFYQDADLESVVLPNGLSSIENWTFCGCVSLASVNIPDSLISISDLAFAHCSSLVSISFPNTLETIGLCAFGQCSSLSGDLVLPSSLQRIGESCFYLCTGLTGVVIPESLHAIPESAFFGCSSLSGELVIPDQCTIIESEAFSGCSNLSSLTIGAAVATLGHDAFTDCTGLEAIYCNTTTPPYTPPIQDYPYGGDQHVVFYNVPVDIPVHVNCLSLSQFQANVNWMQFTNMQGVFLGTPELTVNVNNPDWGTAEIVSMPSDCDQTTATVLAIPNTGHRFGCWKSGNAILSYDPEYSFSLNQNHYLTAYFDVVYVMTDSIGYPDQVIGRKYNGANMVTAEYVSDFTYNDQNGILDHFYFPSDYRYTHFAFFEYPTKPSSISSSIGYEMLDDRNTMDPPITRELLTFFYEDDHQIRHSDRRKWTDYYDLVNYHYDYYYNNHKLNQKDSSYTDEDGNISIFARNRYSYENGNKIQIDSAYTGTTRLTSVTTNVYDDAHRIQNVLTVSFNASGEITSRTRKLYTYTANNKTDTIVTQTLSDGEWVNSSIAHYVYDLKHRVVEYQTGSWSADDSDWNITKKILYDFNDETQKETISFKKKTGDDWVWDVFSGQSLFNDSRLYEWQRQLANYSGFGVNQFEISMHYNTIEQQFPILSEWYYEILGDDGLVSYQHLEYMADTTIKGDKSKIIVRTNQIFDKKGQIEVTHEYVKENDNKVYWWNKELQEFTMLYDYMAEPDDEWEIKVGTETILVHVDSVGIFDDQGDQRKVLHISDPGGLFNGDIIVGYGHTTSFFPEKLMNKSARAVVDGLRCYWVAGALLYHRGEVDCDAIYSNLMVEDEQLASDLTIYPNPTTGILSVRTNALGTSPADQGYRISNRWGQILLSGVIEGHQIDVSGLPQGLYFLTIGDQTLKLMKR